MIKELARTAVAAGCRLSALLAGREAAMAGRLTILCYHRVLPAAEKAAYFAPDLVVTPHAFAAHCAVLARRFTVLTLGDAYALLVSGSRTPKPLVAITFDDGYRDNHDFAAPVLARHALPATFFAIADLAGTERVPWYDALARCVQRLQQTGRGVASDGTLLPTPGGTLTPREMVASAKQLGSEARAALVDRLIHASGGPESAGDDRMMTWQQLRKLAQQGHEIGSHSCTHAILPQLDDSALRREVFESKRSLELGLGQAVRTLCYPNGDFDARTTRLAREAGYACAVSTLRGDNDVDQPAYELRRRFIHEGRLSRPFGSPSATQFRLEISGLADSVYRRSEVAGGP